MCDTLQKVPNLAEKSESFLAKNAEYPSADKLENFDEQHGIQSVLMRSNMTTVPCGHVMQSFAKCLDGLQDKSKTSLPREIHVVVYPPLNIGLHLQVVTFFTIYVIVILI